MRTASRALVAALMIGLVPTARSAAADEPRSILVLVDDRSSMRPGLLDQAGKETVRIMRAADIRAIWTMSTAPAYVNAAAGDERSAGPRYNVRVIIQPRFQGAARTRSQLLLGAAPPLLRTCGGVVYLFFDQIAGFASLQRLDAALVLGTVGAHEIGNVLLGHNGHAGDGLMRASWSADHWQRAASGFLLFSADERQLIHRSLASCE